MRARIVGLAGVALVAWIAPVAAQGAFEAPTVVVQRDVSIDSVGDFDGDGNVDGLGWWWKNSARNAIDLIFMRGDGAGGFTQGWRIPFPMPSNLLTKWQLAVGRFNADNRDDFVLALDDTVMVHVSGASAPAMYAAWRAPFKVRSVVVADFDRDGRDDIAISGAGVSVHLNTGQGFRLASSSPVGAELRAADLDDNGTPDLITTIEGQTFAIQTLFVANGVIASGPRYSTNVSLLTPPMVVTGDIDNDGDDDVALFTMAGQCMILRATSAPAGFNVEPPTTGGPATDFADVDGDGDLDGLCCGGSGPGPKPLFNFTTSIYRISYNDGTGQFARAREIQGLGARRLAGAVDVDKDGFVDLVAGRCVFFHAERFARGGRPAPPPKLGLDIACIDIDGDGDRDLAPGSTGVFVNDGSGTLSTAVPVIPAPRSGAYVGPGFRGDFDRDGDVDLIVGHTNAPLFTGMRLFENTGGGDYVDGGAVTARGVNMNTDGLAATFPSNARPGGAAPSTGICADFNNDNRPDLLVARYQPADSVLWLQDAQGQFSARTTLFGGAVAAADFDLDGNVDVLTHGASVSVYWGRGDGTFDAPTLMNDTTYGPRSFAIGDLNGDKRPDIVLVDTRGPVAIRITGPGRLFSYAVGATVFQQQGARHRVAILDFDGDGDSDVIASPLEWSEDAAMLLANDGAGNFTKVAEQVIGWDWIVEDVDGDGDTDVISDRVILNRTVGRPIGGYRAQYGVSTPGLGGMTPVLGASGPFRVGETAVTRLRGGRGGSTAYLAIGSQATSVVGIPGPGLTAYTLPTVIVPIPLTGKPGEPGTGGFTLPFVVPPSAVGTALAQQCFVIDPAAPSGFAQSNGLALFFGP